MWLQDIVSPTLIAIHWRHGSSKLQNFMQNQKQSLLTLDQRCIIYENLETLRGINANNFHHLDYMHQIDFIDTQANILLMAAFEEYKKGGKPPKLNLASVARSQTEILMMQLVNITNYYRSVPKFLRKAIDIFFPSFYYTQAQ